MQLPYFMISLDDYMLPCLNKKLFGIECPGCGAQRAISFLLKGDFIDAFTMYPAIFTIIPLLGFLLVDSFFTIKYSNKIIITLMVSSVILILGNYILKFL
ncbi:DUF2752 domain-containing protein [Maribacter polysiphoniae]|uniref:DUF2752 domain-containing protein n=1 Tax=Maribacter polysiphoniae TaxID=429344 RepID=A0A316DXW7_9FLAO|nr:DUF2752 domain-containing protein [Maribacter polysiphoniae]MBD1262998.1 DUF2752 domain-containing protein [Maribacter polysiphoniae]PWK22069.1 uncharacterized protein DUF2752 [Maribacter polysiphoniae]